MSQNLYLAFFASLLNAVSSEDNLAGLGVRVKKFMASALKNTISVGMKMSRDEVDALTDSLLETYNKDIVEISEFHNYFADFIEKELKKKGKERLVILVDDLDRLEPNVAVGLLEVIKLFADVKQCVFVMAIDYDVVVQGVRQKYRNDIPLSKCRSFFDKIIQLSFRMPVEHYELENLVAKHYRRQIGAKMRHVNYHGKSVIILRITCNNGPAIFNGAYYTRSGPSNDPAAVKAEEMPAFFAQFV